MNNLLDMLKVIDNNQLVTQISDRYDLEKPKAENALASLMPAFSQGLRRNANTAQDMGNFVEALANGNHLQYIDAPSLAFSEQGKAEGNKILGHLFKSKDLSRKIATQASLTSGVSPDILKQMLPALAPLILGSLTKSTQADTPQYAASSSGGGLLGNILKEVIKQKMGKGANNTKGSNPIGDILEQMMRNGGGLGGALGQKKSDPSANTGNNTGSSRDERLGDIFGEMLQNKTNDTEIEQNYETEARIPEFNEPKLEMDTYADEPTPSSKHAPLPSEGGLEDLFGEMFRPSSQETSKHDSDVESIFDEFLGSD